MPCPIHLNEILIAVDLFVHKVHHTRIHPGVVEHFGLQIVHNLLRIPSPAQIGCKYNIIVLKYHDYEKNNYSCICIYKCHYSSLESPILNRWSYCSFFWDFGMRSWYWSQVTVILEMQHAKNHKCPIQTDLVPTFFPFYLPSSSVHHTLDLASLGKWCGGGPCSISKSWSLLNWQIVKPWPRPREYTHLGLVICPASPSNKFHCITFEWYSFWLTSLTCESQW